MDFIKNVLVTGSEGFIGRHLCPALRSAGWTVTGIDKKNQWTVEAFVKAQEFFNQKPFDAIIHLAANIEDIDARLKGTVKAYQDVALDYRVCEYVHHNPPRVFVAMSSCAVDNSADPYAWVKLNLEQMALKLNQTVPTVILRPFSGYGHDQALTYPFPAILKRALLREDPLEVWGSLDTVRDWIHVDDIVRGIIWAIDFAPRGIPIQLGTGRGTSFEDLAFMIANEVDYDPTVQANEQKPTSSRFRVAVPDFAGQHGFETRISLAEGIKDAVDKMRYLYEAPEHRAA